MLDIGNNKLRPEKEADGRAFQTTAEIKLCTQPKTGAGVVKTPQANGHRPSADMTDISGRCGNIANIQIMGQVPTARMSGGI